MGFTGTFCGRCNVSAVERPLGHGEVIHGLWRALERGRLPHALLFEGPAGIGKFMAARWFAQGVYCAQRNLDSGWDGPCGECGPCKRFSGDSHPDVFVLDPLEQEMESIKVAAVAERDQTSSTVCGFFRLRAMEGKQRTVIVREFERAEISAQNALLKTLEEPGEDALLILETSRADLLLETIRSRCVTVRFSGLDGADCARALGRGEGQQYVQWAAGSPGTALRLGREGAAEVRAVIGQVLAGQLDPFAATGRVLDAPGEFAGGTPTAQIRARTRSALDLLLAVLRDGLRAEEGQDPASLAHGDLAQLAAGRAVEWGAAIQRVIALRGEVELNLNPEGVLDRALLQLPVGDPTKTGA